MAEQLNEEQRRQLEEEWRKCLEELDRAERDFSEALERTRADLDREEVKAKARFAEGRREAEKHFSEVLGKLPKSI